MASRLGQHLLRAKSMVGNFGLFICPLFQLFVFCCCFFFICFLTASSPTFGCYRANSLTHPMFITAFGLSVVSPELDWRGWVSTPNWVASELSSQCHNTPNCRKFSAQTKTPFFQNVEMPQIPKTGRTWHCGGL